MIDILWMFLILFLFVSGIYFSKKLHFENLKILKILKKFTKKYRTVFFMSIGTKIGVGSIIGTAIVIYVGGPGSLFWIWIFSIVTSSWIYIESLLGSKYKVKKNNYYVSGPNFYIKNKLLSNIYLVILIISYSFFFLMIQTNTLNEIITINFNISKQIIFIFMFIILLLIIFSSVKEILNYINKIVPFLSLMLITISLFTIINNYILIKHIFFTILDSAFSFKSILTSTIPLIIITIKRNIFQNELLIGTTSIAAGVSEDDSKTIAGIQVIANLFISLIICTLIGFLIIIFKLKTNYIFNDYNELISNVFLFHYGNIGSIFLLVLITLFCFTTIISGYYFGLTNLSYITNSKLVLNIFRVLILFFSLSGLIIKASFIWYIIDIMMLILIIINIYSIIKLRKEVFK